MQHKDEIMKVKELMEPISFNVLVQNCSIAIDTHVKKDIIQKGVKS